MKTLKLTLHKKAFEVTGTPRKLAEYRKPSKWIMSRLVNKDGTNKHYDYVEFTNGYGKDKPKSLFQYLGWDKAYSGFSMDYANGLRVDIKKGDVIIFIGEFIDEKEIINFNNMTEQQIKESKPILSSEAIVLLAVTKIIEISTEE